jgi:hypothetical protein
MNICRRQVYNPPCSHIYQQDRYNCSIPVSQSIGETPFDQLPPITPITPTIPGTVPGRGPTYTAPAPTLKPQPLPAQLAPSTGRVAIPAGAVLHPVNWDHNYGGTGPCKPGKLGSGPTRDTCRLQANLEDIYKQDYMMTIGDFSQGSDHHGGDCIETGTAPHGKGSCSPRLEITSGGPGSGGGSSCCGFTIAINNTDGTLRR